MRSSISLVVLLAFFFSSIPLPISAQQNTPLNTAAKPFTAVLDLVISGDDLPKGIGATLADKIREVMAGTGKYRMINRGDIEVIMTEIGRSQSGLCDQSCEIEVGRQLSAKFMVTGRVSKLGAKDCKVFAQLTDVETGEILKTASDTSACDGKALEGAAENVAMDIAGIPRQPGKLLIQSNPQGAAIFVDGEKRGLAPLHVEVRPGSHKVTAFLKGYKVGEQNINVPPNVSMDINFSMVKEKKKFYQTWWFYTVVGAVVIGGVAAAAGMGGRGGGGAASTAPAPTTGSVIVEGPPVP